MNIHMAKKKEKEKNIRIMVNWNMMENIHMLKKNGKCIEYDNDDNLIFEGEYLKGKRIEKNFLYFNKISI